MIKTIALIILDREDKELEFIKQRLTQFLAISLEVKNFFIDVQEKEIQAGSNFMDIEES